MAHIIPRDIGCNVSHCPLAGTNQCDYCPVRKNINNVITIKDFTTDELLSEIKRRINGDNIY
jgi:hypothetical protein